jgi:hypothetical protein
MTVGLSTCRFFVSEQTAERFWARIDPAMTPFQDIRVGGFVLRIATKFGCDVSAAALRPSARRWLDPDQDRDQRGAQAVW